MGCCCSIHAIACYCATCRPPSCEWRGFCSWPHGCCYSFMAVLSGFAGVFMNAIVVNSCYFCRIKLINPVTGEPIPGSERGYGFRGRETDFGLEPDYGTDCSFYSSEEVDIVFDSWFTSGKAFAWMSLLLGLIAFLVLFFTCMCAYSGNMFERWLMWTYIFATICLAFSFLAFGAEHCQENKCKVAPGSGYAISTFLFWLSCANTVKSMGGTMPPPRNNNKRRNPFRRNKNREQDQAEEDEWLNDMYYETDEDKYPLPETTPEGRKRYAHAEAYANDTEKEFAEKYDNDYSSSEEEDSEDGSDDDDGSYESGDEDESDYGSEDDNDDRGDDKHNAKSRNGASSRNAPTTTTTTTAPQHDGPQPDYYHQELSEHDGSGPVETFNDEPEEELITLQHPQEQTLPPATFDHQPDFLMGHPETPATQQQQQPVQHHTVEDPFAPTSSSGVRYNEDGQSARVGAPDGPTLT